VVQSNYHIELTPRYKYQSLSAQISAKKVYMPSDVGNWDRHVVQDILKEIAQTQQVDLNAQKRFKGMSVILSPSKGACLITRQSW